MAYATASQLLERFDARDVGDLVTTAENVAKPTSTELLTNGILATALENAAGLIKSAAMVANKYTADTLDALALSQDAFLIDMNCSLAMGSLLNRKSMGFDRYPMVEQAFQYLATLRFGERIFDVESAKAAGNVQASYISVPNRERLRLVSDVSFFPRRMQGIR